LRKVLCSIGAGPHQALLELSGETFSIFAARHGYELDLRREVLVADRAPAWSKIALLRECLDHCDLVLWVDADAAIVDPTIDIADELARGDVMAMVAHEYDGMSVPNAGVWVLRNRRSVRRLLDRIWNRVEYLDHDWWENAALLRELGYTVEPTVELVRPTRIWGHTRFVDRSWNSISVDAASHPRINHYPGHSQEHRILGLTRDLATARAVADSWETPLPDQRPVD
jgi:hypothetical protein